MINKNRGNTPRGQRLSRDFRPGPGRKGLYAATVETTKPALAGSVLLDDLVFDRAIPQDLLTLSLILSAAVYRILLDIFDEHILSPSRARPCPRVSVAMLTAFRRAGPHDPGCQQPGNSQPLILGQIRNDAGPV